MLLMDLIKYSLVTIVLGLMVIFPQVSFADQGKKDKKDKKEEKKEEKEEKEEKGKLAQFEAAVEKKDEKKEKHVHEDECCSDNGSSDWAYPFFEILLQGGTELFFGFPSAYPPEFAFREYSPYPYADPAHGRFGGNAARPMSFDASGYYLYSSSTLDWFGFRSRFSPHPLLSLEFQFTEFREQLAVGDG